MRLWSTQQSVVSQTTSIRPFDRAYKKPASSSCYPIITSTPWQCIGCLILTRKLTYQKTETAWSSKEAEVGNSECKAKELKHSRKTESGGNGPDGCETCNASLSTAPPWRGFQLSSQNMPKLSSFSQSNTPLDTDSKTLLTNVPNNTYLACPWPRLRSVNSLCRSREQLKAMCLSNPK